MKTCFKCGETKELDDFYAHKEMADGHLNKCKVCTKADEAARYHDNKKNPEWLESEIIRGREKARRQRAQGTFTPSKPEVKEAWRLRNPDKDSAHNAVRNAIKCGRLIPKPCEKCGEKIAEAHHDDYSKPLCVRWLCDTHHKEYHVEKRRLERLAKQSLMEVE